MVPDQTPGKTTIISSPVSNGGVFVLLVISPSGGANQRGKLFTRLDVSTVATVLSIIKRK